MRAGEGLTLWSMWLELIWKEELCSYHLCCYVS